MTNLQRLNELSDKDPGIAELARRYPDVFEPDIWKPHRPLKIGIGDELVALGVMTVRQVHRSLGPYCRRLMYLKACTAGAPRVGLDGAPDGEVTHEQAARAAKLFQDQVRTREERAEQARLALRSSPPTRKDKEVPNGRGGTTPLPLPTIASGPVLSSAQPKPGLAGSFAQRDGLAALRVAAKLRRELATGGPDR
jgi:ProP effector